MKFSVMCTSSLFIFVGCATTGKSLTSPGSTAFGVIDRPVEHVLAGGERLHGQMDERAVATRAPGAPQPLRLTTGDHVESSSILASFAARQDAAAKPAKSDEEWQFTLSPYLWAVAIDGDITIAGMTAPIDLSFSDILDDFSGGGSLFFEGQKGQWGFAVDGTYITMETSEQMGATTLATDTSVGLLGLEASYKPDPGSFWDLIAGVRFFDIENDITVTGSPTVSGGISSEQVVIGARGRWTVKEKWRFALRGDFGFGSSSDTSWQVLGLAGYQIGEHWGLDLGYRVMGMDVGGSGSLDATLQGLMLGVVFEW